jgi:ABC-type Na+ transport system ATPase subunit NatA
MHYLFCDACISPELIKRIRNLSFPFLGKTTLSHILSCEIGATGGDLSVFGYSVVHDPDSVRGLVAVCKQDDYLYPDLSAKEHLEVFGGLRGVPSHELPQTVQKWLESVDLAGVQDQYSEAYSGGMKRRLSLACSTIGGRPLIILDEPTTGETRLSRELTPFVPLYVSHNSSCCSSQAWTH